MKAPQKKSYIVYILGVFAVTDPWYGPHGVVEAIFWKYRSIRGCEKKSRSKILFFHEEILISKFGLGIFFGVYLLRFLKSASRELVQDILGFRK